MEIGVPWGTQGDPAYSLQISIELGSPTRRLIIKDSSKLKVAIYNYETDIMPDEWSHNHRYIDYILPSSSFSKGILIKNGWPKDKCIMVPHGVDFELFKQKEKFKLNTSKKFKFLNVSIPHR